MKAANFLNILLAIAVVILAAELHKRNAECRMQNAECATGNAQCTMQNAQCQMCNAECRTQNAECVMRDAVDGVGDEAVGGVAETAETVIDSTDLAPSVKGFGGPVPVEVVVADGHVKRVSPKLPNDETPGFFKRLEEAGLWRAWDGMAVETAATARVDAVTGATYSSEAAIANVRAALAVVAGRPAEKVRAETATMPSREHGHGPHGDFHARGVPSASDFALAALGADASAITAVPPPAPALHDFDVHADFADNPFTVFRGKGMLLCAGDREKSNAMTIGWGGLGTLWGPNDAVTVYVAEKRHTRIFMDKATHFTVMAFDKESQANILDYMGHNSGRDGDKAAALGLHTAYTDNGTPYYEEAQMVLECELMYATPFDPAGMKAIPSRLYSNFPAGVHTMYIGRIVKAMRK